ncbi:tripartite tricarboxylate transporter substrate binding protein [Pseudalkalibacillus sp. A8]|uniref:tripartite tricarboxylate transporter substrate binding protein n=1 Tax=Pseudalkalibacillus sp. A8 TaxID=3382641 RepID=UPI0038B4A787
MKRLYLFLVSLLTILLILAGCGSNSTSSDSASGESEVVEFPTKDLKVVVPFSPGGAVDVTNRLIAKYAPDYINGHEMIIENKDGGGGVVGQTYGANAAPDGYTITGFTSSVVSNPLTTETSYTHESFTPIAQYMFDPEVVVVKSDSKFETLEDFIEGAKTETLDMVTPGHSTSHHTAAVILADEQGLNFKYVHTGGGAEQLQQILGDHVDVAMMTYGEVQNQYKDGSVRILGVMGEERSEALPDVPTFKEVGIDMVYGPFRGIAVPKDTPEDVVKALDEIYKNILTDEGFVKEMATAGYIVTYSDSAKFQETISNEYDFIQKALPLLQAE